MKNWYQSKTVLINLIALLLGLLPMIDAQLLTFIGVTSVDGYLYIIGFITGALNLILRMSKNEQTQVIKFFNSKE